MGLIAALILYPYFHYAYYLGIGTGIVLALLPKTLRIVGFVVLSAIILLTYPSLDIEDLVMLDRGKTSEQLVPFLIVAASVCAAIVMLVIISVRIILGKIVKRIRETTSVRTQVIIAGCTVFVLGIFLASFVSKVKPAYEPAHDSEPQRKPVDVASLAGDWYQIHTPDWSDRQDKDMVRIETDRRVSINYDRDNPFADDFAVKDAIQFGPDFIRLQGFRGGEPYLRYMLLTRYRPDRPDWPRPFTDNQFVESIPAGDAEREAELLELIESAIDNDYQTADQRRQSRELDPGIALEQFDYKFPEDLVDTIHNKGIGSLYRLRGFDNLYAAFVYGSVFYVGSEKSYLPCRYIFSLIYVFEGENWTRMDRLRPERVCNYDARIKALDAQSDEESRTLEEGGVIETTPIMPDHESSILNTLDRMLEPVYDRLLVPELEKDIYPYIEDKDIDAITALADFPLTISVALSHGHSRRTWTKDQLTEALSFIDGERTDHGMRASRNYKATITLSYNVDVPVILRIDGRIYRTLTLIMSRQNRQWHLTGATL